MFFIYLFDFIIRQINPLTLRLLWRDIKIARVNTLSTNRDMLPVSSNVFQSLLRLRHCFPN